MTLLNQALETIGRLSKTSKMPCYSWSLPATACKRGSWLRKTQPDSVCAVCYARKGHYCRPNVQAALKHRLEVLKKTRSSFRAHVDFVHAFAYVLNYRWEAGGGSIDHAYFRWFDSGDLQDEEHFNMIYNIAKWTPGVYHFLPTREPHIVDSIGWEYMPENLTVRLSSDFIDQATDQGVPSSVVISANASPPKGYTLCKANQGQDYRCGSCRQCWDPDLNIAYRKH